MSSVKDKQPEQSGNEYLCRVCLKYTENVNSIFEPRPTTPNADIKIVDEIYFCTNLEIDENSRCFLICEDCLVKLTIAVDFKKLCHSSQRVVEDLINEDENFGQERCVEEFVENCEDEESLLVEDVKLNKTEPKVRKPRKPQTKKVDKEFEPEHYKISGNNKMISTIGREGHQCQECDKVIYTITGLELHQRIHRDERNFECEICNKKFRQKGALLRHMDIHSDAKRFKCEICDRGFNDQTSLKAHMYTHSDAQNHKCNICDKSFKYPSSYAYHMQAHNNDRKHQCDECDAAFIRPYKLAEHKRIHTGEKPFECEECFKKFRTKKLLVSHARVHNVQLKPILLVV